MSSPEVHSQSSGAVESGTDYASMIEDAQRGEPSPDAALDGTVKAEAIHDAEQDREDEIRAQRLAEIAQLQQDMDGVSAEIAEAQSDASDPDAGRRVDRLQEDRDRTEKSIANIQDELARLDRARQARGDFREAA